MSDTRQCVTCAAPIRRTQPDDGLDPDEYPWVHEGGNPYCGLQPIASPELRVDEIVTDHNPSREQQR